MALHASMKRTRALRTSSAQYEELIGYMESHSEFAAGKFLTKEGKIHHIKQWEELTRKLNALSTGTQKSTKQWQTVWRDMKSTAPKKASKLRNERHRTGNFPVTAQPLSTIDQRVIACMGLEYVQGSVNCPDSTPEEEEYQLRLETGETEVLDYTFTPTSIEDLVAGTNINNSHLPPTFEENETPERMEGEDAVNDELCYNDVVNIYRQRHVEDISAAEENVAPNSQTIIPNRRRAEQRNVEDIFAAEENVAPNSQTIIPNQRRAEQIQRNRRHRQRIGVQLQEARENFGDIAEKLAEALKLFAEALMKMTENDSRRLLLEEKRLEVEEKRIAIEEQIKKVLTILLDKIGC